MIHEFAYVQLMRVGSCERGKCKEQPSRLAFITYEAGEIRGSLPN